MNRPTISIVGQIRAIDREIAYRNRVYPRLVASRKMTNESAEYQVACMVAVRDTLESLLDNQPFDLE